MSTSHEFQNTNCQSCYGHCDMNLEGIGKFVVCINADGHMIVPFARMDSIIDGIEWFAQNESRERHVEGIRIGASLSRRERNDFLKLHRRVSEAGESLATYLLDRMLRNR